MFKIDNAIILAAGRGSRMLDLCNDIPKPLLKINNKTIIENIIDKLYKSNIKNVTIVVGYMAEKFLFLQKLYGVKIINNINWEKTNNISSINVALNDLKNTLIINGDVIINDFLFPIEYESSCTFAEFNEKINEWYIECDNSGRIVNYIENGVNHIGLFQREVTIVSKQISAKIKKEIKKFNQNLHYEHLILYIAKKYHIDFKPFIIDKNKIYDIDSKEKFLEILKVGQNK